MPPTKASPESQVTAGLCKMMANKILELLKKVERCNIMITGGTARNRMMIEYLQQEIPGSDRSAKKHRILKRWAPHSGPWKMRRQPYPGLSGLILTEVATFDHLPPLQHFADQVEFKSMEAGTDPTRGYLHSGS